MPFKREHALAQYILSLRYAPDHQPSIQIDLCTPRSALIDLNHKIFEVVKLTSDERLQLEIQRLDEHQKLDLIQNLRNEDPSEK